MQAPQQLRHSMRKGSRLTFGHLSYVASYKHPTARKSRGRSHNKLARPAKCNRGGIRLNRGLQGHRLGLPSPRGQSAPQRANGFRSLKDTWADTTTPHGRLMLTVLGGLAEFERELIRARTGEGRSRAKARGVRFGRNLPAACQWRVAGGYRTYLCCPSGDHRAHVGDRWQPFRRRKRRRRIAAKAGRQRR
jgi:hypothetical protein